METRQRLTEEEEAADLMANVAVKVGKVPGGGKKWQPETRAGHFRYFLVFSIIKNDLLAFFIKLIWLGVGFLNRSGAEIGYKLDKKWKKIIFFIEKIKKYRKCPALQETLSSLTH